MKISENSFAQELVREAGGPEKLSAAFLAGRLKQYAESGDCDGSNAVLHVLVEAARDGNYTLINDSIEATSLRLIPAFVGVMIQLEQHPNFDSLLEAIHREVPAEKALVLISKACAAFAFDWKHRSLLQCAALAERLGEELVTRHHRDDLGAVVGTALLCKARSLHVVGESDEAIEASDDAIWFLTRASFFGGPPETQEALADACVFHGDLLAYARRPDDARFFYSQANESYVDLLNQGRDTAAKIVSTFRTLEKLLTDSGYPDGAAICRRAAQNISATMKKEDKLP